MTLTTVESKVEMIRLYTETLWEDKVWLRLRVTEVKKMAKDLCEKFNDELERTLAFKKKMEALINHSEWIDLNVEERVKTLNMSIKAIQTTEKLAKNLLVDHPQSIFKNVEKVRDRLNVVLWGQHKLAAVVVDIPTTLRA